MPRKCFIKFCRRNFNTTIFPGGSHLISIFSKSMTRRSTLALAISYDLDSASRDLLGETTYTLRPIFAIKKSPPFCGPVCVTMTGARHTRDRSGSIAHGLLTSNSLHTLPLALYTVRYGTARNDARLRCKKPPLPSPPHPILFSRIAQCAAIAAVLLQCVYT